MKTAAQVFIILSMVCGFWMILPLIFGGIALSQMSKGQGRLSSQVQHFLDKNSRGER